MKLMIGNNQSRLQNAVEKLEKVSKGFSDYFLTESQWSCVQIPFLNFQGKNWNLSDRALVQLSERISAGNFLPSLIGIYKETKKEEVKKQLEELFIHVTNTMKGIYPHPLLFRTNNGEVEPQIRAVLSNQYVILNNYDLLISCLETLKKEADKNEVPMEQIGFDYEASDDYSSVRFYFVNDYIRFGDDYRGGIIVKNGECGDSSFDVQLILFNSACRNVLRTQVHYGIRHSAERVFRYSELTNRIQAEVVYRKAAEMTAVLFSRSKLEKYYEKLILHKDIPLEIDKAQLIMRRTFSNQRVLAILDQWKAKEEPTVYGLAQAITEKAQEMPFGQREREEEFASRLVFGGAKLSFDDSVLYKA